MMNVNGEYSPTLIMGRTGVHAECNVLHTDYCKSLPAQPRPSCGCTRYIGTADHIRAV